MRSETHLRYIVFCMAIVFLFSSYALAGTWETLHVPGAVRSVATGVDGDNIVGWFVDASNNTRGFIYDGSTYQVLDAFSPSWTQALGISGSNVVGTCGFDGFLYNGTNYQFLNVPGSINYYKSATDIDAGNIVGVYSDDSGMQHGFLYNGSGYSTIDPEGSTTTYVNGISGDNIVGQFSGTDGGGYVYNISTGTTTNLSSLNITTVYGIDGDNILGRTWGPHNVLYNMKTHSMAYIDMPGVSDSTTYSISGNKIVGVYLDSSYVDHAFVYTIPEPCTLLLLGLGAAVAVRKKR